MQGTGYGRGIGSTRYIVICRIVLISSMVSTHLIQCPKPPRPNGVLLDTKSSQHGCFEGYGIVGQIQYWAVEFVVKHRR